MLIYLDFVFILCYNDVVSIKTGSVMFALFYLEVYMSKQKPGANEGTHVDLPLCISIKDAAKLSGIGINKIEAMLAAPDCPFLIRNGRRRMIKTRLFVAYIEQQDQI